MAAAISFLSYKGKTAQILGYFLRIFPYNSKTNGDLPKSDYIFGIYMQKYIR